MTAEELLGAVAAYLAQCQDGEAQPALPVADLLWRPYLSPRELEVLVCMAAGLAYVEVAQHLSISERTVRTHADHIIAALQCAAARDAGPLALASGRVQWSDVVALWRVYRPWFFVGCATARLSRRGQARRLTLRGEGAA